MIKLRDSDNIQAVSINKTPGQGEKGYKEEKGN